MRGKNTFGALNLKGLDTAWPLRNWLERQTFTIDQTATFGYNKLLIDMIFVKRGVWLIKFSYIYIWEKPPEDLFILFFCTIIIQLNCIILKQ